ncbi:hypothetical protein H311_00544 [Anncaliia algerae PRA109]|nr:hypothetical protein H311_00544 [Anncaliia algerae PRA109]
MNLEELYEQDETTLNSCYKSWELDKENELERDLFREAENYFTELAANKMINRKMWKNSEFPFKKGVKVLIKTIFDNNKKTKKECLLKNLDETVYIVDEVLDIFYVRLFCEENTAIVIERINICYLGILYN